MPLNVENKTYVAVEEESALQQVPRAPHKRTSGIKYFFIGLAIILVVSSSVFLIYIFLLHQQGVTIQPQSGSSQTTIDTSNTTVVPPPPQPQPGETATPVPQTERSHEEKYTIYIAAYTTRPPAAEDISRWNEAGFVGAVIPTIKHYRVSLGRFTSISDARTFAEQWTDAFEYGYWIGSFQ